VLERFGRIAWDSPRAPQRGRAAFDEELRTLRRALDDAQRRAVELDTAWGRLGDDDLVVGGRRFADVEAWWRAARENPSALTQIATTVMTRHEMARRALKQAEALLRPWVIRHLKDRRLPAPHSDTPRRVKFPGRAFLADRTNGDEGIPVAAEAVLPFLLAARATTYAAASRALFAEGVDLHLNCRQAIHHDLCWNPSTLEQRTGRVDRIGAKCERAGRPIHVYLPYVAETQDEKMYRVVMDRARWFSVVMGEQYRVDENTAEKLARRVPFPPSAAEELRFALHVVARESHDGAPEGQAAP